MTWGPCIEKAYLGRAAWLGRKSLPARMSLWRRAQRRTLCQVVPVSRRNCEPGSSRPRESQTIGRTWWRPNGANRESEKGPKGDLPGPPAAGLRPRICALSRERSSLRRPQAQVCPWHAFHCRSIAPKRPHTISSVRLWDGPAGRTSSLEEFEPNLHECRGIVRSRKRRPHVSVESQSPERRKTRTKAGALSAAKSTKIREERTKCRV
jgi:hypothetical protein